MISPKLVTGVAAACLLLCLTGCLGFSSNQKSVQPPPVDFSLNITPTSATVTKGGSTSVTASVSAQGGFSGTVQLDVTGAPAGVTASLSSSSVNGSGDPTLSVTTSNSAAPGTYTLTLWAASGSLSHNVNFSLVVSSTTTPDFSLSATPSSQTVTAGSSTSFTVSASGSNGFTGTVALVESGIPAGMLASCSPASISGSGSCTLNVSTTSSTAAGTYTLTITGTSGTLIHSATVSVTVNATTLSPDFTLSASPGSQSVTAGNSTTFTASVSAQNGFTGTVVLAATGLPTGVTASFAPASISTSGSSTLTLTSSKSVAAGTYTLTISGTSGILAHNTNVSLVVSAAVTGAAMNVLEFPGATGDPWFKDVPTYLFNNSTVNGATIGIEWGGSDQGPSAGSSQYDWTYPDAQMQPWVQAGKKVNFVVWANADNSKNACGPEGQYGTNNIGNCAIPTYVWTALGSSNYTTCTSQYGTQQLPNYFATAFQSNYQKFMVAVIQHYQGNPNIGYIRFGLGHGGESLPVAGWNDTTTACGQAYVNAWGLTIQTWENYLSSMLNYQGSLNSPVQLMVGVTPMNGATVPDYVAPIAVQNNIGFGSQGLEATDVNNCSGSTADWCSLFGQYTGQVPLELQTIGQSCPTGTCTTGSLVDLIPFAVTNHATVFEIYYQDWLTAYDPNYPGYFPAYQPVLQAAAGK